MRNVRLAFGGRGVLRLLGLMMAGLLLAAGCGSDDETSTSSTAATTTSEVSTTSSEPETTTSTTAAATTTTESATSTTASSTTDAPTTTTGATTTTTPTTPTLPGEPFVGFIEAGDELGVMGVAFDDVLNVRASPGTDQPVVATLEPTAQGVEATGEERRLSSSIWYEVTTDSGTGWVGSSFVAFVGGVDDATAEYLAAGGPTEAETIAALGELVAMEYASEDPPSRISQTVAPSTGDFNEVTYDVVGLGDDSGAGYRLHLFVLESEDGEGFVLRTIERTSFCSRGLAGELCV